MITTIEERYLFDEDSTSSTAYEQHMNAVIKIGGIGIGERHYDMPVLR